MTTSATAAERVIADGPLWDRHNAAINFWCVPDDRPAGWPADVPITAGDLSEP